LKHLALGKFNLLFGKKLSVAFDFAGEPLGFSEQARFV
jgi:hypothetical protein